MGVGGTDSDPELLHAPTLVVTQSLLYNHLRSSQMLFSLLMISRTIRTNALVPAIERLLALHTVFDYIGSGALWHGVRVRESI